MQDAYDHLNKKIELYYSGKLDEYLKSKVQNNIIKFILKGRIS